VWQASFIEIYNEQVKDLLLPLKAVDQSLRLREAVSGLWVTAAPDSLKFSITPKRRHLLLR
jgi:hypothetical protein